MKIIKCELCGKMAAVIKDSACPTMCCGQPMKELEPNTTDASQEKHVPVIKADGTCVCVEIGSAAHPMIEEHYIEWIILETKHGRQRIELCPGAEPKAYFALVEGDEPVAAYAYCNLHGLWKAEV